MNYFFAILPCVVSQWFKIMYFIVMVLVSYNNMNLNNMTNIIVMVCTFDGIQELVLSDCVLQLADC